MEDMILIYMFEELLKPTGGPAGYVYNLRESLGKVENIYFRQSKVSQEKYRHLYNKLPHHMQEMYRVMFRNKEFKKLFSNAPHITHEPLNDYDYIHFHSTDGIFALRDSLKEYTGKVILTSHTPKPSYLEMIEDLYTPYERKRYGEKRLGALEEIDCYAFDHADYIVFPCEEAEEPYYNNWSAYKAIKARNKHKYRYLLTGTRACTAKLSRKEVLEKYHIPKDAFIVSFVGRHNETKGYDTLKQIGEKLLKEDKNIYFLIAGKEAPLQGLKHERWIEVGWTNDPHSIVAASDVFILPNKETYFDLVLLEVLSLGKLVVATFTGGNKYFRRIGAEGIKLYETQEEAINLIYEIKHMLGEEREVLGHLNKQLFDEQFNNDLFGKRYLQMIESFK